MRPEETQTVFSAANWAHGLLTDSPDRFLLVSDGKRVRAAALAEEVGRFRAVMNSSGIGEGQIVAVSAERSVATMAVLLACFCEGASPFLVDARQDHDVLAKLFDALRIHGLYCGTSLDPNGFRARLPYLKWVGESGAPLQVSRISPPDAPVEGEYILHTAGTCGLPRAMQHSASAIEWQAKALKSALRLGSSTEVWFTGSLALSPVFALGVCAALSAGGALVLDDPATMLSTASRADDTQRLLLMAQASDSLAWTAEKLLSIKGKVSAVMTTDFSLTESYATTLAQATDAAIWNGFSLTEASGFLTVNLVPGVWPPDSVGRPIGGAEIEPCTKDGDRAGFGEIGRLTYHRAPTPNKVDSLTFQTKSETRTDGYVTGDWGVLDGNDFLYVRGCEKTVFYRAGFPVEAGYVEGMIRGIEGIDECIVYALPDEVVESEVVAAVVSAGGGADIRKIQELNSVVPRYLLPERIESVNALPRTPTGKVVRFGLPIPSRGSNSVRTQSASPVPSSADAKLEE